MILNHFIFALRNFRRRLVINSLNTLGLSIGLAAFLVLAFYIYKESSFDQFHKDADFTYRVESYFLPIENNNDNLATASFGYGPAMKKEIPEVQDYCRIMLYQQEKDVKYKDQVYREQFVTNVDSNFFSFFSFPLLDGDPLEVLNAPLTMVISKSASRKYFNNEDPIGKVMEIKTLNFTSNYTVTGVFEDFPETSHFKSDFLLSYPYSNNFFNTTWYMHEAYLYIKTAHEANVKTIQDKFTAMSERYKTTATLKNKQWGIELIPLKKIHLNEPKAYELENKGSRKSLNYLTLIAFLVIIIAWVNYINISTTYALERRGEVGVRKVNGARFREILGQFIAEAGIANFLALLLAFFLMIVFLPLFQSKVIENDLTGIWFSPILWVGALVALILGILLTGCVPAIMLTKIKTANALVNKSSFKGGNKKLRELLVVSQFAITIVLIVATLAIRKQINYMTNQDLGVDINQTLVFNVPTQTPDYIQKLNTLNQEIENMAGVQSISVSSAIPGKANIYILSNRRVDKFADKNKLCEMLRVDYNFVELYDLEIIEGRYFAEDNEHDKDCLVLSETAAKLFGFNNYSEAIHKEIVLEGGDKKYKIIGILKDYHHLSLKDDYRPIVFFMAHEHGWIRNNYISVKVFGNNFQSVIDKVKAQYASAFPDASFEYFFLDQYFNNQYHNDRKFGKLFFVFTWLGIFIVCLGILGLSGFVLLKRTKEIGLRKVNGASTVKIVMLLTAHMFKWNLLALLIASPIAYLIMHQWLENFPERTTLSWWIFALAGALALGIALVTVSFQSWRAATRNPVEALRYE